LWIGELRTTRAQEFDLEIPSSQWHGIVADMEEEMS
jgi:hypothetical protein